MSEKRLNLLWITDPWDTLDHPRDTTLRLMEEAAKLGIAQAWTTPPDISVGPGKALVVRDLVSIERPRTAKSVRFSSARGCAIGEFSHVFFRVDPPVNTAFLLTLQRLELLAALGRRRPEFVNPLGTLALQSEKLLPFFLPRFSPRTLVTADLDTARRFYRTLPAAILKPLNGAQSIGISIPKSEAAFRRAFAEIRGKEGSPALIQEFSPAIARGEKRLWFVDETVVAFAQKVPKTGRAIIDMDAGASVRAEPLTASEKRAIPEIGKLLRRLGIRWAAVDLIDGKITDFNHTSPGLIAQLEEVKSANYARPLLERTLGLRTTAQ